MTLKTALQSEILRGQITTKQALLDRAAALGLVITRNGRDYLGLLGADGKRFRVHFRFSANVSPALAVTPEDGAPASEIRVRGSWIYALVACSSDGTRKACYVGQTVNLRRRFREHLLRPRPGRGSYGLFQWAALEAVEVHAVVLCWVNGDQSAASRFEGYWLGLAQEAGFEAPDAHNWGRLPLPAHSAGQPRQWPTDIVAAAMQSLAKLVSAGIVPRELFVVDGAAF